MKEGAIDVVRTVSAEPADGIFEARRLRRCMMTLTRCNTIRVWITAVGYPDDPLALRVVLHQVTSSVPALGRQFGRIIPHAVPDSAGSFGPNLSL